MTADNNNFICEHKSFKILAISNYYQHWWVQEDESGIKLERNCKILVEKPHINRLGERTFRHLWYSRQRFLGFVCGRVQNCWEMFWCGFQIFVWICLNFWGQLVPLLSILPPLFESIDEGKIDSRVLVGITRYDNFSFKSGFSYFFLVEAGWNLY